MSLTRPAALPAEQPVARVVALRPRPASAPRTREPSRAALSLARAPALRLAQLLAETFYCDGLGRRVSLGACIDRFVAHSARGWAVSPCHGCPRGAAHRALLAGED